MRLRRSNGRCSRVRSHEPKYFLLAILATISSSALAQQRGGGPSDDQRWNITGPAWYDTKWATSGSRWTHGLPYANWATAVLGADRVCEYKALTLSYPADPDVPCERMATAGGAGPLVRTYIKRWD